MKKLLLILGGALLALLLVALVAAQFFLGSIVKNGVNRFGPQVTKAPVTLEGAKISPFSGEGSLSNLFVGNPPGWTSPKAFSVARIDLAVEPGSLMEDHVVINSLVIEAPEFVYESKLVASNIGDLMKNIEASLGSGGADPASGGSTRKIEIKHFVLRGGKVTAGIGPAAVTVAMPPIEMHDLGTASGGLTPTELSIAIMRNVTGTVVAAVAKELPNLTKGLGSNIGVNDETLKKAGQAIQGILGGGAKK